MLRRLDFFHIPPRPLPRGRLAVEACPSPAPASSRPVEWVARIEREAVVIHGLAGAFAGAKAAMFVLVARLAKALQRPEAEGVPIAVVRLDVIGDGRRRHLAGLEASRAERLDAELVRAPFLPCRQAIPGTPGQRLARVKVACGHVAKMRRVGRRR